MSRRIYYKQSGVFIHRQAPSLEEFYAALLPHLKAYGITAEFPADKPSTETYISGIKFDVWIGEPPHAIHYGRTQESFYSLAYDDKLLAADALADLETGEKLSFKISSSNSVPSHYQSSGYSLTIEMAGEKARVEAMRNAIELLLVKHQFDSVELEVKPLAEESPGAVNPLKPEQDSATNKPPQRREAPLADNLPSKTSADHQTRTVVPEQPTRSKSFNLLMGAALLLIGIPVFIQFYSRLQYSGFLLEQKFFWGAVSLILIGAATRLFVRAFVIYRQEQLNKPHYEPIDWQTTAKPTNRIKVRSYRLPAVALAILIVFFGGATWIALFGSSKIRLTNSVVAAFSLSIIFANGFLFFRAQRKSARMFDENGIERGDGRRFSWDEFRGVVIRSANTRYGLRGVWRAELVFKGDEEAWIIPNRVKNYDEISAYLSALPRAVSVSPKQNFANAEL